jgi:hypothetical protein
MLDAEGRRLRADGADDPAALPVRFDGGCSGSTCSSVRRTPHYLARSTPDYDPWAEVRAER